MIFHCVYDMSGCRLITAEADKTIKMYKEDETVVRREMYNCLSACLLCWVQIMNLFCQTEESHLIVWKSEIVQRMMYVWLLF